MKTLAKKTKNLIKLFHTDEQGAAMTEYALLIAVVALVLIGTLVAFRKQLAEFFGKIMKTIGSTSMEPANETGV